MTRITQKGGTGIRILEEKNKMEQLEAREKFRIVGTVERLNRHAMAIGQNGKTRPAKSVIQLKPVGESQWQIWISNAKDLDGQRYDVTSIQKLRTNFVNEGKLTIELQQPPLNLMFRDCNSELSFLVQKLQHIAKTSDKLKSTASSSSSTATTLSTRKSCDKALKVATRRENISPSSSQSQTGKSEDVQPRLLKTTSSLNVLGTDSMKEEKMSTKEVSRGVKRAYSDMTKSEATRLRKVLRTSTTNLVVTERSEYPLKGLSKDLQRIVFQNIQLRRVDTRLSDLLHLRVLSLENNRISAIEPLAEFKSCIETLNLSNNLIENINETVFRSKGLSKLQQLSLNHNKLRCLPNSICGLQYLRDLQVSNNSLLVLPYNLHQLSNLTTLKVNDNKLKVLPLPISKLQLRHLDVSSNLLSSQIEVPRKVQLDVEPTLFEFAAAALLSHISKDKKKRKDGNNRQQTIDVLDPAVVPKSIGDHLNISKYCIRCGDFHIRYTILFAHTRHDFAQEAVNSLGGGYIPTSKVVCDKCLKYENVHL